MVPELPEVETVRRGLESRLIGRRVVQVEQRRPNLRIPFPPDFALRLEGRRIDAIDRRAKYLLFRLDDGLVLIAHLGMSGRMHLLDPGEAEGPAPHRHVILHFDDGTVLAYHDARRFGLMTLAAEADLPTHPLLRHVGLEPLGDAFNGPALRAAFAGKRTPLKAALLDQTLIAGIGNIYACEAMFRAGLAPERSAGALTGPQAGRLAKAIRAVLQDAIAAGGSTLRDYQHTDGQLGYFQHSFAVYGREGATCPKPKCRGTVARLVQSNRSTFYCPACQR